MPAVPSDGSNNDKAAIIRALLQAGVDGAALPPGAAQKSWIIEQLLVTLQHSHFLGSCILCGVQHSVWLGWLSWGCSTAPLGSGHPQ